MKKCIVLIVSFVAMTTYAQAPDTLWTRTYGGAENDWAGSILQTSDGGYIVVGGTESFSAVGHALWILRLDSLGDTQWTKTYGEAGYDAGASSIQHTRDNGYIIVGYRDPNPGPRKIWLLKIDENGDTLWTNIIGAVLPLVRLGASDVKQTSDNGYIIAGGSGAHIFSYATLIKTDSLGDTLWIRSYEEGGSAAVQETSEGNYITAGTHQYTLEHDHAFFLMEVDSAGAMLWYQEYTDTLPVPWSRGTDVLVTNDGCLTACGAVSDEYWEDDIYLIRTDTNGDILWTKRFCDGIAHSLDKTLDGGYIIAGETSGDVVFIRTDSLGDTLWTAVYGGAEHDSPSSVLQTSDGGYVMLGETSSFGAGGADVWIVKLVPDVGVDENKNIVFENGNRTTTIFRGPLQLPKDKKCKVFDITGRVVEPTTITRGIYFIEMDDKTVRKAVKVR